MTVEWKLTLRQVGQLLSCMLPIHKLQENIFLFGTQSRKVILDQEQHLVRVELSTGFKMALGDYLS